MPAAFCTRDPLVLRTMAATETSGLKFSRRDYETFLTVLAEPFSPNEAKSEALNQVHSPVQRV